MPAPLEHGHRREIVARVKPLVLWLAFGVVALIGLGMVVGGSLVSGHGHVVTGSIDGASSGDVGKTLDVTIGGNHAYTRSLRLPIVLLVIGLLVAVGGILIPVGIMRQNPRRRARAVQPAPVTAADHDAGRPVEEIARDIRALRQEGRLAEAVALVDELGWYGIADDDFTTSLSAAVLTAYGDELRATDPAAADAAYERAVNLQLAFASGATAGGEGIARSAVAKEIEAKRH